VNRGAKFVATLRLVYPHADTLCEKDFDWLFDCPQTREFIEWFCSTVTEENVLSPAEVEAYEALLAAGKPILEGNALERALQMCRQVPQLPRMVPEDEGPSQEDLQQELQELEDYRNRQLWRHEKMKALAANLQQQLRYLEEEEKAVNQDLRKAQMDLEVEIVQTSAVLRQISKDAKQLAEWYGDMGKGQPPALLCEMDLGPYLEVEQQVTDRFEKLIQQILPENMLTVKDEERDDSQEAPKRTDTKQTTMPKSLGTDGDELLEDQDSFWKELSQIEKAHICAQREVIVMSAKVEANSAALEWVQKTMEALEENQPAVEAELCSQAARHQRKLHALHCNIRQILNHQLPALLKAEAHLSCLPVLQRQLGLEAAFLKNIARRQKKAAAGLLGQQSRLDLLELHLKWERKEMEEKAAKLRETETAMREAQVRLQKQREYLKDASSSCKDCPDPKDLYAVRLWDMLVGPNQEEQQFCSYEALAAKCSQLVQDQRELEAKMAASMSQFPALESLESSTEVLYQLLYNSSNQLQLSSPEITKLMQQLTTMQDKLYQILADLLRDLKVKRRSLENPLLQTEHNLYVYFYCNEDRLREVVEELEKQLSASSQ
ncbi:HAUS3 protein, partial [Oreotrochilus melanogaster]|nr:HAUS3 protein [Oreotrochilus melanogaster]